MYIIKENSKIEKAIENLNNPEGKQSLRETVKKFYLFLNFQKERIILCWSISKIISKIFLKKQYL